VTDVTLTRAEMHVAAQVGCLRAISALRGNRPDRHGADSNNGWSLHIEGAAGELAVARVVDRFWTMPVDTFKDGGDVGAYQVRTRSSHSYELIVRPDDRELDRYILVTGRAPHFTVRGWVFGYEARKDEWLQTHGEREPAWFVPHHALHGIETIGLDLVRRGR